MSIEILIKALSVALMILFIHASTWEGMIMSWVRKPLYGLPLWIKKPLYMCPICMTSIWGITLWFLNVAFIQYFLLVGGIITMVVMLTKNDDDGVQ